ncbi:MAG: MBL fold metallo-hydrolase [Magnetospirillum sp.]|nr:MBL fold metallo-hydrolase [Magnetospirillum sp.]
MNCVTLFRREGHRWLAFSNDGGKPDAVIDTNQYVVCADDGGAMLLDPGGMEAFPPMLAALTQEVAVENVRGIFFSHQDPDVSSSLPLWRRVCQPETRIHVPALWVSVLTHLDREATFAPIPDEGMEVTVGGQVKLRLIPAHYLHSPGNFHAYDPKARILFSGDMGGALVPAQAKSGLFVENFSSHVAYMETFHRRWMGSPRARDLWVETVSRLDIDIMAPQHGLAFKGDDVKRFLDWISRLELGSGCAAMAK